ncbi:MAG: hypothetical protein KC550_06445 [Nanoarchaeota archaeon]|nr:hypothetical protein [Nanoarchaeota archaeon]
MRKLKIYLDTSVISFLFADDSPEYKNITIEFFEKIEYFQVFISDIVQFEINKNSNIELKEKMFEIIQENNIPKIEISDELSTEIDELATLYINNKVIPEKKKEDAYHIAISTVFEFDVLLSWNFRHLANIQRNVKINSLNRTKGYLKELRITTPLEVLDFD